VNLDGGEVAIPPQTNNNLEKKMAKFAFISRHAPTEGQIEMAKGFVNHPELGEGGIELIHVGDMDAFTVEVSAVNALESGPFVGVIVVHPAAALALAPFFLVGIFENATRTPVDGKPVFEAKELHIFDLRD
jgi:hypothetical protein